jgi:hypothetical protein
MTSEEEAAEELVAEVEAYLVEQSQVEPVTEPWPRPRRPAARRTRRAVSTILQAVAVMLLAVAILIQLLWR